MTLGSTNAESARAKFSNGDMAGYDLAGARLRNATLVSANLHKTLTRDAEQVEADRFGANLESSDLTYVRADTGIRHSEMNETDEVGGLFQIWVQPDRSGHKLGWQMRKFPTDPVAGLLPALATGRGDGEQDSALPINQDHHSMVAGSARTMVLTTLWCPTWLPMW